MDGKSLRKWGKKVIVLECVDIEIRRNVVVMWRFGISVIRIILGRISWNI